MKILRNLFALLAISVVGGASAQKDLAPDIIFPDPEEGALLYGISDNGRWGVSSKAPDENGFSDFAGAKLFDLSTSPVTITDLTPGEMFGTGMDVTDDGTVVAGAVRQKPAICRLENGKWTWYTLPIPEGAFNVRNNFTDQIETYYLTGGEVTNLTPDGRYAVGLVRSNEYIMFEMGCMWDLETMEIMELPDLNLSTQSRFNQISADGRYLLGRSGGYFIYDRETKTRTSVRGVALDIYAQGMSPNGRYISGAASRGEVDFAAVWDTWEDQLTVFDGDENADAVCWTTANNGVPLIAKPYINPYASGYVYHDGFIFSFEELLTQVYGINLASLGIDNTGKPFQVSADGSTIVMLRGPRDSYVIRFKEDIRDALDRIDLFRSWRATPANNTGMSAIGSISVTFAHPIQIDPMATQKIQLLDSKGTVVASPISQGGVTANGNTVNIQFRTRTLEPGETYSVRIPEGTIWIKGREKSRNPEININYTGRENVPVKPVSIQPKDGAAIASFDLNDNPVVVTFDTNIKVNGDITNRPMAQVYIDDEETPIARMNIDVDQNTGNRMVIFPDNTIMLYKGSTYKIVVPDGAVSDISGNGLNESFSVSYEGSYTPQLGDEKYLFQSNCDNYTNFLFYEGDHGTPIASYADMGFTADETPWSVVRESLESVDMAFGSHSCYVDGRQSDDWVTTRQVVIPEGTEAYLSFDSQSYRRIKKDYLKVYVYVHEPVLNNLNKTTIDDIKNNADLVYNELQDPGKSEENLTGDWRHNVIDLTPYAGKKIYICFHNDNQNQSMVMIDNIEVVRKVDAFLTLRNATNVVGQSDIKIWGVLSVASEIADYQNLSMTLLDHNGKEVSSISKSGLSLKYQDTYDFEFPQMLPLSVGEENEFTIEFKLDDDKSSYNGVVRDLTFEPVKRVVIEEFTGRDCQFCPAGIVTMEHLESVFGDKVVPIALHCYQGTDPKGANVMGYWEFTGMDAAPQGRINRGPISAPLYQTSTRLVNTKADIPGDTNEMLWKDWVVEELNEPALMVVELAENASSASQLNYTATVVSAINLHDQNIRVFGVLLEDGLVDTQRNAYYSNEDPILGEWGKGGIYGKAVAANPTPVFNNVARSTWGQGYNGTAGLIPATIEASKEYTVDIKVPVPGNISNIENCKFAVMLIDENTGRVINATTSKTPSGVNSVNAEGDNEIQIQALYGEVQVASSLPASVYVYSPAGMLLGSASGQGNFSVDLNGYHGIVIVKASNASGVSTAKYFLK